MSWSGWSLHVIKDGHRISEVTKRDDGSYRPNFRPVHIDKAFDLKHYVSGMGLELLWALEGLVEKSEE